MEKIKFLFDKKHKVQTLTYLGVIIAIIVVQVLLNANVLSSLIKNLLVPVCCFIVASLALNLCVGLSGELSLGHAGFMSIGAFSAIIFSSLTEATISNETIRLILSLIVAALVAAFFGFLIGIPVLKLEGDYLAIVTLAFCQIIVSLVQNVYLGFDANGIQFSFIENKLDLAEGGKTILGGPIGATGVTRISTFLAGGILILVTLFIIFNLMNSKNGRAIMACRDNKIAASTVGIDVTNTKMLAFVISAAIAGSAGALFGLNFSTMAASSFTFNQSILMLVYVVLGGLGNIPGTIISTILLYSLPELLRSLADYRMIIYSLILIIVMIVKNNDKISAKLSALKKKLKKEGK